MKNKFTDWLDTELCGVPRAIWLAVGMGIGIVINVVIIALL